MFLEISEPIPLKRNKRSSTSSSSNRILENGSSPSPPKKKKLHNTDASLMKAASPGKENLLTCKFCCYFCSIQTRQPWSLY